MIGWRPSVAGACAVAWVPALWAAQDPAPVLFEERFLRPGVAGAVDLKQFSLPAQVPPGNYWLDVSVNQQSYGRQQITYRQDDPRHPALPCFDRPLLQRLGVATQDLAPPVADGQCAALTQWLPPATVQLNFAEQRLALQVPQASLQRQAHGQVDAQRWEWGVNSAFANYDLNAFNVASAGGSVTQAYAGLSSGANLGPWHWRLQGNVSNQGGYQTLSHYVQREVAPWNAQLRLGHTSTSGALLESVQMRGATLFSDERMLPASQRGFAPTVRGVARGNARVTIRQGGRLLREVVVPPGPYVIDDLYAATLGADLQVSVSESDGSEQHFTVANAAPALALREGQSRFALGVGSLYDRVLVATPAFLQGSWQQGASDWLTAYGGGTLSEHYYQGLLGATLNTTAGAIGLDVAMAQAQLPRTAVDHGARARVTYSTVFQASDTRIALSHQQADTPGYHALLEAQLARERNGSRGGHERSRTALSFNQPVAGDWGQINAGIWQARSWGDAGSSQGYSLNYGHRVGNLGFSLSATRERDPHGRQDTVWLLDVNLPLGGSRASLNASLSQGPHGSQGQVGYRAGGERHHYGASVSASEAREGARINAYGGWREPFGEFGAAAGHGDDNRQMSVSARGAVVAHAGGITLAQPLAETFAIIQVPDANGARVSNASQVRVDGQGYAIVPHLVPYQLNRIDIDPLGLPLDVELSTNSLQVAPRAGAVTLLRYPTHSGRTALIELRQAQGLPLPFGAQVTDEQGVALGVVGQGSRVLARGLQARGRLHADWGTGSCRAGYVLPVSGEHLATLSAVCEMTDEGQP